MSTNTLETTSYTLTPEGPAERLFDNREVERTEIRDGLKATNTELLEKADAVERSPKDMNRAVQFLVARKRVEGDKFSLTKEEEGMLLKFSGMSLREDLEPEASLFDSPDAWKDSEGKTDYLSVAQAAMGLRYLGYEANLSQDAKEKLRGGFSDDAFNQDPDKLLRYSIALNSLDKAELKRINRGREAKKEKPLNELPPGRSFFGASERQALQNNLNLSKDMPPEAGKKVIRLAQLKQLGVTAPGMENDPAEIYEQSVKQELADRVNHLSTGKVAAEDEVPGLAKALAVSKKFFGEAPALDKDASDAFRRVKEQNVTQGKWEPYISLAVHLKQLDGAPVVAADQQPAPAPEPSPVSPASDTVNESTAKTELGQPPVIQVEPRPGQSGYSPEPVVAEPPEPAAVGVEPLPPPPQPAAPEATPPSQRSSEELSAAILETGRKIIATKDEEGKAKLRKEREELQAELDRFSKKEAGSDTLAKPEVKPLPKPALAKPELPKQDSSPASTQPETPPVPPVEVPKPIEPVEPNPEDTLREVLGSKQGTKVDFVLPTPEPPAESVETSGNVYRVQGDKPEPEGPTFAVEGEEESTSGTLDVTPVVASNATPQEVLGAIEKSPLPEDAGGSFSKASGGRLAVAEEILAEAKAAQPLDIPDEDILPDELPVAKSNESFLGDVKGDAGAAMQWLKEHPKTAAAIAAGGAAAVATGLWPVALAGTAGYWVLRLGRKELQRQGESGYWSAIKGAFGAEQSVTKKQFGNYGRYIKGGKGFWRKLGRVFTGLANN